MFLKQRVLQISGAEDPPVLLPLKIVIKRGREEGEGPAEGEGEGGHERVGDPTPNITVALTYCQRSFVSAGVIIIS